MADRSIPEDNQPVSPVNSVKRNIGKPVGQPALMRRAKMGKTLHQQHVEHQQHMANVKNNPQKYG